MAQSGDKPVRLNNTETWSGAVGLALGVYVVRESIELGLGTINDPGSGYVLFYTGLMMCLFAGGILFSGLTEGGPKFSSIWEGVNWSRPLLIIVALMIYAVALDPLGFLVTTIPLMLLLLRAIDPVPWLRAIIIAVSAPLIVWWVLKYGLLIQLPSGAFQLG